MGEASRLWRTLMPWAAWLSAGYFEAALDPLAPPEERPVLLWAALALPWHSSSWSAWGRLPASPALAGARPARAAAAPATTRFLDFVSVFWNSVVASPPSHLYGCTNTIDDRSADAGGGIMQIHISSSDGVPIYLQIVNQVKYLVASGRLAAGAELPPIRVLAERLLINPSTVARAYRELETAGIVEKRRTAGTYVSDPARPWPGGNGSKSWPSGSTPCWPRPGR